MKKLFTVVFTMLLAGSLAFGQTGSGTPGATSAPASGKKTTTGKKTAKTKARKGVKKSKKSSGGTSVAPTK